MSKAALEEYELIIEAITTVIDGLKERRDEQFGFANFILNIPTPELTSFLGAVEYLNKLRPWFQFELNVRRVENPEAVKAIEATQHQESLERVKEDAMGRAAATAEAILAEMGYQGVEQDAQGYRS